MIANRLIKNDTIGVISSSNWIRQKDELYINKSVALMQDSGFKVKFGKYIGSNTLGYGPTPQQKAEDINNMFKDKAVKAIFCVNGGYNSNTIFEYLDYECIKNNPKIICGFSDPTSILNIIYEKTHLVTFHGATFKSLTSWETDYAYKDIMKRFVYANIELGQDDDKYETIKEGIAEGILLGGNLNLFSNLICGKYCVDCRNKILFLEELGLESGPGMVSNYLYYMKQNGVFDKIKGLWIGNYEHESGISLEQIVKDVLGEKYDFPIIKSNNFGHTEKKTVIPIGIKARIDTSKQRKIELLENCVR